MASIWDPYSGMEDTLQSWQGTNSLPKWAGSPQGNASINKAPNSISTRGPGVYGMGSSVPNLPGSGGNAYEPGPWSPGKGYYEGAPLPPKFYQYGEQAFSGDKLGSLIGQLNPSRAGFNAASGKAMQQGPSAWAGAMRQQNAGEAMQARNRGNAEAMGNAAQARGQLAMRGGLNSGARERIASDAARNQLSMSQNVGAEQAKNNLNIGVQDEAQKNALLGQVMGQENNMANFDMDKTKLYGQAIQGDTNTYMSAVDKANAQANNIYQQQGLMWGAGKQADSTAKSGGGGTYFCTELLKRGVLTKKEIREIHTGVLLLLPAVAHTLTWYLENGQGIVNAANEAGYDWKNTAKAMQEVLGLYRSGKLKAAAKRYTKEIIALNFQFMEKSTPVPEGISLRLGLGSIVSLFKNKFLRGFIMKPLRGV